MTKDLGPRPQTLTRIRIKGRNYIVHVQYEAFGTQASVRVGRHQISGRLVPFGSDKAACDSLLEKVQGHYPSATPVYSS